MKYFISLALISLIFSGCSVAKTNTDSITEMDNSFEGTINNTPMEASESHQLEVSPSQEVVNNKPIKGAQSMSDTVKLTTSKGIVELKLYPEEAPKTVANFLAKADEGYYENLTFHRVEDWVVQGGDPEGTGRGGSTMPTELNDHPFRTGSLGVARGMDIKVSNDSQFFICTQDCDWLNGQYTNFGEVIKGMDVVKKIEVGDTITSIERLDK